MTLPNFLVIGAAKAGTNALYTFRGSPANQWVVKSGYAASRHVRIAGQTLSGQPLTCQ